MSSKNIETKIWCDKEIDKNFVFKLIGFLEWVDFLGHSKFLLHQCGLNVISTQY